MLSRTQRTIPVGEHPIPERHAFRHDNRLLLAIIAVLVIALVIISLMAFTRPTDNAAALRKAAQLEQVLKRAGLPTAPYVGDLAASLGTNGGLVCETSGLDLPDALLNQQLSTGGVLAVRPIPVDKDILNSQLAIIEVYCPSRAAAFMKYFKEYKVYKLIRS